MHYSKIVNRLLAADDLHWDELQGRFVSLSQEQVHEIVATCADRGITDPDEIKLVVGCVSGVRISELLRDAFLSGRLKIAGFRDGEPLFSPLDDPP